jgi:hypothetical protein
VDLQAVPAIVKIMGVFGVLILCIRFKAAIGHAFVLGSLLMGVIFEMPMMAILKTAGRSLLDPKTLSLAMVVSLILVLSHSMEEAGQMERLLKRFQGLVRHPGLNLIVFPAMIGLLPMPGGAIFSAPMVGNLGRRRGLSNAQLSFINYWFRHIWEYWWPLYPGVLLATSLAGLNLWTYVLFLLPLSGVAFSAGYLPIRKDMNRVPAPGSDPRPPMLPFLEELTPIALVIFLGVGLGAALSWVWDIPIAKEIGLIVSLLLAVVWVWEKNALPADRRWAILKKKELLHMVYMVGGILVFKGVLEESGAVSGVSAELLRWNMPLLPISIILPMIVGGVAGITIAFVGTTFPILISLVNAYGQSQLMLAYLALGMTGGFVGVLFSPLHLCLILSNGYFHTTLVPVYRYLIFPCAALILAGGIHFLILRGILL